MKQKGIVTCLLCVCIYISYAHDTLNQKQTYSFRFQSLQGKLQKNFEGLPPYSYSQYYEFDVLRNVNGSKEWHASYSFPETGVSFLYGDLGNDSVLGSVFSAYPTLYFNTFRTNKLGLLIKAGVGFAYFNTPFNMHTNTENIIIGSHITNITTLGLLLRYQLT